MTHLLFDLDGTLTDPREGIVRSIRHALLALGREPPAETRLLSCIGPPLAASFAALLGTHDEALIRSAVSAYRERFESTGLFENAVYPGIAEGLRALASKGHSLRVVTAKPARYAERILRHFSLRAHFDAVVGPDLTELRYTKSDLVARALKGGDLDPADTVMIGDRAEDIEAARANGASSIAVTWGYGTREEIEAAAPSHVVSSVSELIAFITGARQPAIETREWNRDLVSSYDRTAERYAETFFHELDRKPYDRALLDAFAASVRGAGEVCDLGCGPGHVARYLKARGVDVFGIDLSPRMIEIASRRNPEIVFRRGDMLALDVADGALAGLVAFYSLIHLSRKSIPRALSEIHSVLRPGGLLLLSVHGGEGEIHADEFLGQPVSIDATLFHPEEMAGYLLGAGFSVESVDTREPYDFEFQSTRVYITAKRR